MIHFSQVIKRYAGGYEALKNISFEIEDGEMVPSAGGDATPLTPTPPSPRPGSTVRFSRDGRHLYYVESGPTADQNIWRLSFADGKISPLTRLAGRGGRGAQGERRRPYPGNRLAARTD